MRAANCWQIAIVLSLVISLLSEKSFAYETFIFEENSIETPLVTDFHPDGEVSFIELVKSTKDGLDNSSFNFDLGEAMGSLAAAKAMTKDSPSSTQTVDSSIVPYVNLGHLSWQTDKIKSTELLVNLMHTTGGATFENIKFGSHISHIHYGITGDWIIRSASAKGQVVIQDNSGIINLVGPVRGGGLESTLNIATDHGNIQIGPMNELFSHFATDRPRFFFNREIVIASGSISAYNAPLTFKTGVKGDEKIRVTIDSNTGNVGIGISQPLTSLHMSGDIRGGGPQGTLQISTVNGKVTLGSENGDFAHLNTDRPKFFIGKEIALATGQIMSMDGDLQLRTGKKGEGTTRVIIDGNSGYVGIGGIKPVAMLHVAGSTRVGSVIVESSGESSVSYEDSKNSQIWKSGANENGFFISESTRKKMDVVVNKTTGFVGIGQTQPASSLHVNGLITSSGIDIIGDKEGVTRCVSSTFKQEWKVGATSDGYSIVEVTSQIARLAVKDTTGFVGINTIAPRSHLEIAGKVWTQSAIIYSNDNALINFEVPNQKADNKWQIGVGKTGFSFYQSVQNVFVMTLTGGGVAIGTPIRDKSSMLHVDGSILSRNNRISIAGPAYSQYEDTSGGGKWNIGTTGTNFLIIDAQGTPDSGTAMVITQGSKYVGFGTIKPKNTVHIVGILQLGDADVEVDKKNPSSIMLYGSAHVRDNIRAGMEVSAVSILAGTANISGNVKIGGSTLIGGDLFVAKFGSTSVTQELKNAQSKILELTKSLESLSSKVENFFLNNDRK